MENPAPTPSLYRESAKADFVNGLRRGVSNYVLTVKWICYIK
jgi:hypothetical protein